MGGRATGSRESETAGLIIENEIRSVSAGECVVVVEFGGGGEGGRGRRSQRGFTYRSLCLLQILLRPSRHPHKPQKPNGRYSTHPPACNASITRSRRAASVAFLQDLFPGCRQFMTCETAFQSAARFHPISSRSHRASASHPAESKSRTYLSVTPDRRQNPEPSTRHTHRLLRPPHVTTPQLTCRLPA